MFKCKLKMWYNRDFTICGTYQSFPLFQHKSSNQKNKKDADEFIVISHLSTLRYKKDKEIDLFYIKCVFDRGVLLMQVCMCERVNVSRQVWPM